MSEIIPTVKIKADNDSGFVVINECDFDEKKHELFVEGQTEEQPKTEATTTAKKK